MRQKIIKTLCGILTAGTMVTLGFFTAYTVFAQTVNITPTNPTSSNDVISITSPDWTGVQVDIYITYSNGSSCDFGAISCGSLSGDDTSDTLAGLVGGTNWPDGVYHFVVDNGDCTSGVSYAQCLAEPGYISTIDVTLSSAPPLNVLQSSILNASTSMVNSIGVAPSQVGTFMIGLSNLVLGSGLGVFTILLPYIIALITTLAISFIIFRWLKRLSRDS